MKTKTFNNQATAAGHSNDKRDPFEVLETGLHAFHRPGRNFAECWGIQDGGTRERQQVLLIPSKAVGNMHDRPLLPVDREDN